MADRRGQVAHSRGSGEAVASTRSEEQRMAIIFLLQWLEGPKNATVALKNVAHLWIVDLYDCTTEICVSSYM